MKINAGDRKHTATDGTVIHTDRPLSQSQVDLIVQMLRDAGARRNTVIAVEFEGEQPPIIHWRPGFRPSPPDRTSPI